MEMKNQRKPLLYYWLIALLVMGIINMFFLPFMAKNSIQQVNYDVFLTQVEEKNVSQAEVNEDVIYFFLKDEMTEETTTIFADNNAPKVYSTVRMDDPQLVERLFEAGVSFGEVRPKEVSPLFSTLI
ncbi:MAG: ATP-dependent metallopeptidase FtsH/Yme1/Tma family protein, partial [Anaerotignum sp.]|nr:ATP-dependent metallopeptidase FtsH/Yme1/Tma family protein [Anaerotignum sp.]